MRERVGGRRAARWGIGIGLGWLLGIGVSAPAVAAGPPAGRDTLSVRETRPEVPELTAFHEVIFALWHQAWPDKDAQMMKDLLPQAQKGVAAVAGAELPGILRDKQAAWDEGVTALQSVLTEYEDAVADDNTQAMADAVEALHARFEGLVRTIRPAMPELDAFHGDLYRIYHSFLPGRDLDSLRAGSSRLAGRGVDLTGAEIPARFGAMADSIRTGFRVLADRSAALDNAARDGNWSRIETAVNAVHDQYQEVERLFDSPPPPRE